jgi:hypothetical protein
MKGIPSFVGSLGSSCRYKRFKQGHYLNFFYALYQHCFICRPSDSTVSKDEPRTVATSELSLRCSNHSARSHPQEIFILPWLRLSAQYKNKFFLTAHFFTLCVSPFAPQPGQGQSCWVACQLLICVCGTEEKMTIPCVCRWDGRRRRGSAGE